MSTGLECQFVELDKDEWYYFLQDYNCPVSAWDWLEYSTSYGPFGTYEIACEHLRINHANPGGHFIIEFCDLTKEDIIQYRKLIDD